MNFDYNYYFYLIKILKVQMIYLMGIGDWGLGIGDWGLGIGKWVQKPNLNPQDPTPKR